MSHNYYMCRENVIVFFFPCIEAVAMATFVIATVAIAVLSMATVAKATDARATDQI